MNILRRGAGKLASVNRIATFSSLLALAGALSLEAGPIGAVPERILVKFRTGAGPAAIEELSSKLGLSEQGEIRQIGLKVMHVPAGRLAAALQSLNGNPNVEFAEEDVAVEPALTPNDPYFSSEWHLTTIAAPAAWDVTTGSSSVIIAILDTGVDGTHPDLSPNLVAGWNTYDNNSNTTDVNGHGTWVSGTAAAAGNNGIGVASVAYGCKLMPVRISDTSGIGYASTIASGLTWAADHGARVANISYEVTGISTVSSAASYFQSKGGVVTVSAGNDSSVLTLANDPTMITVSATDSSDAIASFSNTGKPIDLAAPGVGIETTTVGGGYGSATGTSFSAPTAAGVAALVISANPKLSSSQIEQVLEQSADDLGVVGWDPVYGYGRVNAQKAVNMAVSLIQTQTADTTAPTVSFTAPLPGQTVSGSTVIQISASDNVGVASVTVAVDGTTLATLSTAPYTMTWNSASVANGTHTVTATARDAAGNSSQASVTVNVSNLADITPPVISIVSPISGATVSRTVSVTVNATDNVGVKTVQLYVDGAQVASSSTAPFTTSWNTRKAATGAHQLQCRAYDAAGNVGFSQSVTVYK